MSAMAAALALPLAAAPVPTPTGKFSVEARGWCSGKGEADVTAGQVTITVEITKDDDGQTGTLTGSNLKMTNGRFMGTGTYRGLTVTFEGRVDAADNQKVKTPRINCSLKIDTNKYARVAGNQ